MRNLKRALSLALASVMLVGMMVVGTSAGYADVDADAHNTEAIEVLQAVGAMKGDENGNFNPEALLTRQEMAVVLSNLMDYRVSSYAGTCPFGDVADWAEPYVAACYTNGLTAGMGETYYGATENLTTAQAALMLMKVLGYFQYASDFGADWELATVKQANKIDLFSGVDAGVKEYLTRNDLAQLVLNTIEAGTVEADNDTIKVEADNVSVEAGSIKYNWLTSGKTYAKAIESSLYTGTGSASGNTDGSIIQLGEKLFNGNLKKEAGTTGFNAPATKWTYNNKHIGTYADAADYVFTGSVKSSAMYAAVGKDVAKNYTWTMNLDGDVALVYSGDSKNMFTKDDVIKNDAATLKSTGNGTTTYVYLKDGYSAVDAEGKNVWIAPQAIVCVVRSYVAEIIETDDETVTVNDAAKALDFDTTDYEDEDVVVYTKSYDGKAWTIEAILGEAAYVEGTVDQVKDIDNVVIDGSTYKYNTTVAKSDKITLDSYDQLVGFYLDKQGYIGMVDEAVESGDYAYVIDVYGDTFTHGDKNDLAVSAKLVLADGTVVKVSLDDDCYTEVEGDVDATYENADDFIGQIVSYVVNEDGTYSLNTKVEELTSVRDGAQITKKGVTSIQNVGGTYYGDNNTTYVVCNDAKDDDYSAYVGYKAVPDMEGGASTKAGLVEKNGVAKFVFITGADAKMSAEDVVFVIGRTAANNKEIKSSVGNYYEFKAIVSGETTTIKVKAGSDAFDTLYGEGGDAASTDKVILTYYGMSVNSKGLVTEFETVKTDDKLSETAQYTGTKRQTSAGLIGFGYTDGEYTTWLGGGDDTIVAYYEPVANSLSATGDISTLKTDTNDTANVVTYDGSVIAIIVYENA